MSYYEIQEIRTEGYAEPMVIACYRDVEADTADEALSKVSGQSMPLCSTRVLRAVPDVTDWPRISEHFGRAEASDPNEPGHRIVATL